MKLTDFLQDVGRPVAYHPGLKRITGSTTATILLCQFFYWKGKESDPDGWLYKTAEEIEDETGLTYNEQKTARKSLVSSGLIEEHYARLDHRMSFKINLDAINEKWGKLQPVIPESDDSTLGNDGSSNSLKGINTETTTETTQRVSPNGARHPEKSLLTTDLEKLESIFSVIRKVPLPDWKNNPKGSQKTWRTPLKKIYEQCGNDVSKAEIIIRDSVERMHHDGLTFTKPIQIFEVAVSLLADNGMITISENQPTRRIILPDGQIVEANGA